MYHALMLRILLLTRHIYFSKMQNYILKTCLYIPSVQTRQLVRFRHNGRVYVAFNAILVSRRYQYFHRESAAATEVCVHVCIQRTGGSRFQGSAAHVATRTRFEGERQPSMTGGKNARETCV